MPCRSKYKSHLAPYGFLLLLLGCGPASYLESDLSIDGGQAITRNSANTVPGVVPVTTGCTATVVSTNTALTASHCLSGSIDAEGRSSAQFCVQNPTPRRNVCAHTVYRHPRYSANHSWDYDIAVGIFAEGTFQHYFDLQEEAVAPEDPILMVGYSGGKRWGHNKVHSVSGFGQYGHHLISTRNLRHFNAVGTAPGDSGGPMLHAKTCRQLGICSGGSSGSSLHVNLTRPEIQTWLKSLEQHGAAYCGFSSTDRKHCPASGRARPYQPDNRQEFVCTDALSRPDLFEGREDLQDGAQSLYLAAIETPGHIHLLVSVAKGAARPWACFDNVECQQDQLGLTRHTTKGNRDFYVSRPIDINANSVSSIGLQLISKDEADRPTTRRMRLEKSP